MSEKTKNYRIDNDKPLFAQLNEAFNGFGDAVNDTALNAISMHISEFQVLESQFKDGTFKLGSPQDQPTEIVHFLGGMIEYIMESVEEIQQAQKGLAKSIKANTN